MPQMYMPPDHEITQMIIPVSKQTYFNITTGKKEEPLCAYDMLYHPPDYDPKSARSDRTDPKIIRRNIWDQEFPKGIASTNHFGYGRPKWPILDKPTKQFVRVHVKSENPHMRIYNILEWATLVNEGKPSLCD